jgi:trk system potassium uptake protein
LQASLLTATANVTGYFCFYLAVAMILPMTVDIVDGNDDWQVFLISALIVGAISLFVIAMTRGYPIRFSPRFGVLLINALWISTSFVAALPLYFSSLDVTIAEAVFEAVSGITTTGSTVIVGLDDLPPGLLLWRSLTQMLGGIGVVAAGLLLLPFLNVGGMQIFKLESSNQSDSPFPRFRQFTLALLGLYMTLTLCCALGYAAAGMSTFDAVNHAMATISTGGFSTRDSSMREFGTPALVVGIVFMLIGASPFAALLRALVQRDLKAALDPQIPVFLSIVAIASLVVIVLAIEAMEGDRIEVIVHAVFNVVSIITTTGFASAEYDLWGPLSIAIFFTITFLGGCAGSTSGGIKTYRLMILFESVRVMLRQMVRPHLVMPMRYGKQSVGPRVLQSVTVFISAFFAVLFAMTLALAATGLDLTTALTGSLTALTNVGPGLGNVIGPAGSFESLSDTAKWVLSVGMLMGRLEVMAILILASPGFWRDA